MTHQGAKDEADLLVTNIHTNVNGYVSQQYLPDKLKNKNSIMNQNDI